MWTNKINAEGCWQNSASHVACLDAEITCQEPTGCEEPNLSSPSGLQFTRVGYSTALMGLTSTCYPRVPCVPGVHVQSTAT